MAKTEDLGESVGQRIRFLRNQRGHTLRDLADRCDLSVNAISRIERGKTSPTLSSMHRIAEALRVPITDFFETRVPGPTVHLKPDQRRKEPIDGRVLEILGTGFADPMTEPFLVTLDPGVENSAGPITHAGEEFVYCMEGTVEFEIAGESYQVERGDSLIFKCDQPHCWRNPHDESTRFLVVFVGSEGNTLTHLETP